MLVGDIHFRGKKLDDITHAWNRTVEWAMGNNVSLIAQAGDVFDRPNVSGREAEVGTIFSAFLEPFKTPGKPALFLIPGNHDMGGPRERDALSAFDRHPWIQVAHSPNVSRICKGLSICAVPWISRSQLVAKILDAGTSPKEANDRAQDVISQLSRKMAIEVKKQQEEGDFVLFLGHVEVVGATRNRDNIQSGGNFEFSVTELAEIGADAYALGHIHARQGFAGLPNENDGYLGTLCQLGFGEEGNLNGFRVLDIGNDRKIVEDKFYNNGKSPRYFTVVGDIGNLEYRPGTDYIKLRGEVKPDDLPEGIMFERTAPVQESVRRLEKDLSSDATVEELLAAWAKETESTVPLDKLCEAARDLEHRANLPAEAVGSLDRIDGIRLYNIASHRSTEIDLEGLVGICGIDGPNGGGKTTLLESMLIALYGHCPSRPSLQTLVRNRDGVSDAAVELDFVSGGKRYTARREFKVTPKTFTHKAFIFDRDTKEPVAGPKVDDVKNRSTLLVGDLKMVLSGIFSAQEEMDNLVNLDPAPRKDLLAKLLGTEKFIVMSKMASDEARGDVAWIDAKQSQAEGLRLALANAEGDKDRLAELRKKIGLAQKILKGKEDELAKCMAKIAQADSLTATIVDLESRKRDLESQASRARADIHAIEAELDGLSKMDKDAIKAELDALKNDEKELAEARSQEQAAIAKSRELNAQAEDLEAKARLLEANRKREYAEHRSEISNNARMEREDRTSKKDELERKLSALVYEKASAEAVLEGLAAQAESLKGFPNVADCSKCPLASAGLDAKGKVPDQERKIERLSERIAKGEEVVAKFQQDTEKKIASMLAVPEEKDWQPHVLLDIADKRASASSLAASAAEASPKQALRDRISGLMKNVTRIPSIEKNLETAREADTKGLLLAEKIKDAKSRADELSEAAGKIAIPKQPDWDGLKKEKLALERDAGACRAALDNLLLETGQQEAKTEENERKAAELLVLEKKMGEMLSQVEAKLELVKAFGRDGIPQLIVDGAIPRFQDLTSELLGAFDGRWSISIRSQRKSAKGSDMREVVDILVHDGFAERDISTYSGGERQVLKTVIRIAFATLQAERSGKGLKVMVLDEATDKMETTLSVPYTNMLSRISAEFNQVFVVSHAEHVLSAMPNKVLLSLKDDATNAMLVT